MSKNSEKIRDALTKFYNFNGKAIVHVGAGGGKLVDYARGAEKVYAVDIDGKALDVMRAEIAKSGLDSIFEVVESDFYGVDTRCDAVLFEFCLHEIADPKRALGHAKDLADDVVVLDHSPGSRWTHYTNEFEIVAASWKEVRAFGVRRESALDLTAEFESYAELRGKLEGLGEPTLSRIRDYERCGRPSIPMPCGIALL